MKYAMTILSVAAIAAGLMSACGGSNGQAAAMPPPSVKSQSLDSAQVLAQARQSSETGSPYPVSDGALSSDWLFTLGGAQVLAQARQSSETGSPYPVSDGALVLTDASDTTTPISINGT